MDLNDDMNDSQGQINSQRATINELNYKNQKKSVVELDRKLRKQKERQSNITASGATPVEARKARALKRKQEEEEEEIKEIQQQAREKYGLVENKLNRLENPADDQVGYQVKGQRNLAQFMHSSRRNMQSA